MDVSNVYLFSQLPLVFLYLGPKNANKLSWMEKCLGLNAPVRTVSYIITVLSLLEATFEL